MATLMFEKGNGVELDRMNNAERQILLLLAEGHTAKSIASELGSSPAAVNERLREARRKTGLGSSRELARLLKSQEIRHDDMGATAAGATTIPTNAVSRRSRSGVVAMLFISLTAAAGAAALFGQQAPVSEIDPLLGTPLQTEPDPAALHAQVRTEARDPDWAGRTERAMQARALQIP